MTPLAALGRIAEIWRSPTYIDYPIHEVRVGHVGVLDIGQSSIRIDRRDEPLLAQWAPEGILAIQLTEPHACPKPGIVSSSATFFTGCLLGAALVTAPYTAICAMACFAIFALTFNSSFII